MNRSHAATSLRLLSEAAASRQAALNNHDDGGLSTESENECDSESPIMDQFYAEGGSVAIHQMTNFSSREFDILFDMFRENAEPAWNGGRGKKSAFTAKDVFFMLVTLLKHGGQWDFVGRMFCINGPTFERTIMRMVDIVNKDMYEHLVEQTNEKYNMKKLNEDDTLFEHHRNSRYATDVTFQMANRPSGNHEESKPYFSKKHGMYGYKVEMSVLPNGLAVMASDHYPGSVHDLTIFRHNLEFHRTALRKTENDRSLFHDIGPFISEFPNSWSVLLDKGYQGALELVRAIIPKRNPPRNVLCTEDQRSNQRIAHDRIVVENYFGRLCKLWTIMSAKYRWSEKNYDKFMRICVALTNAHVRLHPLRAGEGDSYRRYLQRIGSIGREISRKRKRQQSEYRARRRATLALRFPEAHQRSEAQESEW